MIASAMILSHDYPRFYVEDEFLVNIFRELKQANLFVTDGIIDHNLLEIASISGRKSCFGYFLDIYPDVLKVNVEYMDATIKVIHSITAQGSNFEESFKYIFIKYSQHDLDMLFLKDEWGTTVYKYVEGNDNKNRLWDTILDLIPAHTQMPFLHHVIKHAAKLLDDFAARYPNAIFLRDENGRSLTQASISYGSKTLSTGAAFFVRLNDDEIEGIDPIDDLYPFATVAAAPECDLSTIYYLLRRKLELIDARREGGEPRIRSGSKKRKCTTKRMG